jgi:rhodanese-related sulfurtransferase
MTAVPASSSRQILRECALILLLAAAPALLAGWLHPKRPAWGWNRPGVAEVDLGEVTRWPPPVLWIDARETDAYRTRHVPGAILLNESDWEGLLPAFVAVWQPGAKIVVYCDSQACDASQAVALRLQRELNQTDIHVLKGGWAAWLQAQH